MRKLLLLGALAIGACGRGNDVESGGDVDTGLGGIDIDVGMTTDTIELPSFGTTEDTVVVDKPVVTGRKPVEVKRPTVDVKRP
jgi:hypothetical protein